MTIFLLLVGLGLIVLGANWLVNGATGIARRAGLNEFVIGLTIAGFGTSTPELVVSLDGAIQGNSDIAVGNVIGSNIFNILFILGLTALVYPVSMTDENRRKDIPITLCVSALILFLGKSHSIFGLGNEDSLTRPEAVVCLIIFAIYIFYSFKSSGKSIQSGTIDSGRKLSSSILLAIAGLAGLIGGGELFVHSATDFARQIGVSDKFIAVTILAGGTSLPELATSLVAAFKGYDRLALGNILGSNVFNMLIILGASAIITPLSFGSVSIIDASVIIFSCVLLLLWGYTGRKLCIDRWEGASMLLAFAAYYMYIFNKL